MVRIKFLDVYKKSNARIAKDTAGGYGTENLFGAGPVAFVAEKMIKKGVFWPSLTFLQFYTEVRELPGVHVSWDSFELDDESTNFDNEDIFFLCSSIVCFETELKCARLLKNQFPESTIVLMGTPAFHLRSNIPEGVLVIGGNYDFLLENNDIQSSQELVEFLNGMAKTREVVNVSGGNPNLLRDIPWAKEFRSFAKNSLVSSGQAVPYIASRGCPYSCFEYCTYPASQGRKVLAEDIDVTIGRLSRIAEEMPGCHVIFRDPVFTIDLKRTKALLREIIAAKLGLSYTAEVHLRNVDEELAQLAGQAGFRWFKFGIESAHENVRNNVRRHSENNDIQFEKISLLKKYGVSTNGMFILCLPADTLTSCLQTIRYSRALGLDFAQFSIFTPYPGTPFYEFSKESVTAGSFEDFSQFELIYEHSSISKVTASRLLQLAYLYFFGLKTITHPFKALCTFARNTISLRT